MRLNKREASGESLPLVSVAVTAFHSERWLPRAIDSVLQQQTAFAFEIVIGDDCSTDGTVDVMLAYQEQFPEIISALERSTRLGMQRNYFDTFEHCRGKYIAWLDADDYWTDPNKLALQVSLLQSDPTVSVCGHFVRQVKFTDEVVLERSPTMAPGRYSLDSIIRENFIPSPSIMFRNGVQRDLPPEFFDLRGIVDWPILVQSALVGDIVLLDDIMADYVLTPGSAYMSKSPLHQESLDLEFCEYMGRTLPSRWQRAVRAARGKRYEAISYHLAKAANFTEARRAALKAFRVPDLRDNAFSKSKTLMVAGVLEALEMLRRCLPRR